jgi:hypothetical protein
MRFHKQGVLIVAQSDKNSAVCLHPRGQPLLVEFSFTTVAGGQASETARVVGIVLVYNQCLGKYKYFPSAE